MYKENHKTRKTYTSPNNIDELSFRGPFQPIYIKTYHIPRMVDHDQENGEHSRGKDHQRNERPKEPYKYTNENEEIKEMLPEDIKKCHKDKHF